MTELIKKHLSEVLYEKRKTRKWSQELSAAKCGKSARQYGHLEKGESLPKTQTLIDLTIIYDIDLNQFIKELVSDGYAVEDREYEPRKK